MEIDLKDNKDKKRFEAEVQGQKVFIEYIRAKHAIYLTHTEVPETLNGQGIGKSLVQRVLEEIRSENEQVAPLCPFVAAFIKEHREWVPMVAAGYKVG